MDRTEQKKILRILEKAKEEVPIIGELLLDADELDDEEFSQALELIYSLSFLLYPRAMLKAWLAVSFKSFASP